MSLITWIKEKLFYLRLWIGRIERCYTCGNLIWNREQGLYDSLYHESSGKKIVRLICKTCSNQKEEVIQ